MIKYLIFSLVFSSSTAFGQSLNTQLPDFSKAKGIAGMKLVWQDELATQTTNFENHHFYFSFMKR